MNESKTSGRIPGVTGAMADYCNVLGQQKGRLWSRDLMDDIEGVLMMVMYYVDRGWASRSFRKEGAP